MRRLLLRMGQQSLRRSLAQTSARAYRATQPRQGQATTSRLQQLNTLWRTAASRPPVRILTLMTLVTSAVYLKVQRDIKAEETRLVATVSAVEEAVKQFCKTLDIDVQLSETELEQMTWLVFNEFKDSPEKNPRTLLSQSLNAEIQRCVMRAYCLDLLLGTRYSEQDAYRLFVEAQPQEHQLTFTQFQTLCQAIQSLSHDEQCAIRATCFMTKSKYGDVIMREHEHEPVWDSEQFLTQVAELVVSEPELMPATKTLTREQRALLSTAFLEKTHLRHITCTEGGDNMLASLRAKIRAGEITEKQLNLWTARWWVNLSGFSGNTMKGGGFLTAPVFQNTQLLLRELRQLFKDADHPVLPNYLAARAKAENLSQYQLGKESELLVAHLICLSDTVGPLPAEHIVAGYRRYEQGAQLAKQYQTFCTDAEAKTPTYTPAVFKSAFLSLKEMKKSDAEATELATLFTCQVSTTILSGPNPPYKQCIVACRDLAYIPNTEKMIKLWLENDRYLEFVLTPGTNELVGVVAQKPPVQNRRLTLGSR